MGRAWLCTAARGRQRAWSSPACEGRPLSLPVRGACCLCEGHLLSLPVGGVRCPCEGRLQRSQSSQDALLRTVTTNHQAMGLDT